MSIVSTVQRSWLPNGTTYGSEILRSLTCTWMCYR